MTPFLDSRHLRLVAEVARAESVTRAADRLHVTQSAVSHQLRDIEERLGTALFVRSGRRMLLTAAGRHLVETAERVLDDIARAESAVVRLARHQAGEFRICTQCYTGYHWLPPLLEVLRRRYPHVEVRIAAEHTTQVVDALLDGKLDLAILTGDPRDRRIQLRPLFEDEHAAIVAPSHPWAKRTFVSAAELAAERLYLYSRSLDDSFIVQRLMRPAGVVPKSVTFLQLTEAILEMVKAGLGVSVLPTWSIAPAIAANAVKAVRITKSAVYRQWSAGTLAGAAASPFEEHFIEVLTRQGRTMGRVIGKSA
jgi:LysR family transcriptional regulator for metE and metH